MKRLHVQRGVTAIEYALLVALIALVILGALTSSGAENGGIWGRWTSTLAAALAFLF